MSGTSGMVKVVVVVVDVDVDVDVRTAVSVDVEPCTAVPVEGAVDVLVEIMPCGVVRIVTEGTTSVESGLQMLHMKKKVKSTWLPTNGSVKGAHWPMLRPLAMTCAAVGAAAMTAARVPESRMDRRCSRCS